MRRIDDKLKEIEQKDKINRLLFIGFIVLIAAFMAYVLVTEKKLEKSETGRIDATNKAELLEGDTARLYANLKVTYDSLQLVYTELKRSLSPDKYWKHIEKENSVEGYIGFLTNALEIDKEEYLSFAFEKLNSANVGTNQFKGWLWVGSKDNNDKYTSRDIVEVIYRKGTTKPIADSEIQKGDIVKLTTARNRKTYRDKNLSNQNELGWRNKTKGFVTNTWKDPNSVDFRIEVKYY